MSSENSSSTTPPLRRRKKTASLLWPRARRPQALRAEPPRDLGPHSDDVAIRAARGARAGVRHADGDAGECDIIAAVDLRAAKTLTQASEFRRRDLLAVGEAVRAHRGEVARTQARHTRALPRRTISSPAPAAGETGNPEKSTCGRCQVRCLFRP